MGCYVQLEFMNLQIISTLTFLVMKTIAKIFNLGKALVQRVKKKIEEKRVLEIYYNYYEL